MRVKKRFYFVKISFPYIQQADVHSRFELPFDFKYLKDCEVFAEELNELLQEANNETGHNFDPEIEIHEEEAKEKEEAES